MAAMSAAEQRARWREASRRYKGTHQEQIRERQRRHRLINRERLNEQHRQYCRITREQRTEYRRQWVLANKEREYNNHLLRKYGFGLEHYTHMLALQGGVCAICGDPPKLGEMLEVDHCHETDLIRCLLCHRCNTVVGHFEDDRGLRPTHPLFDDIAAYVEEYHYIAGGL